MAFHEARQLLPTDMTSDELRQLRREVLEQSFTSARVTMGDFLEAAQRRVASLLEGSLDPATARLELKQLLASLDYQPADPTDVGTIKDLRTSRRLNLILNTNRQLALSHGYDRQAQTETVLDLWPAYELVRIADAVEPRDWKSRFYTAGIASGREDGDGWTIHSGRLIALKNHQIWERLGDPAIFPDAINTRVPPFAFESHMDWLDVDRTTAESAGILAPQQRVAPQLKAFAA